MKNILIFLFCILLFGTSGCFPTGAQKNSSEVENLNPPSGSVPGNSKSNDSTPDSIDKQLAKNLIVNANVIGADHQNFKIRSISLKKFDVNQVKKTFLKNKTIVKTHEVRNDLFPKYKGKGFQFSDGSLVVGLGSIRYQTDIYSKREYGNVIYGSGYFARPNLKDVYKKTTLDSINKQNAIKKVKNVLNKVGIHHLGNPEVIALDLKTLQDNWKDFKTKGGGHPPKWKKGDAAYVVTFPVVYDHTNITTKGYQDAHNHIPVRGSRILGVVNKDGLIYFTCTRIYKTSKILKNDVTPISLETALGKVKNKYKNLLLTDPVVISKITLAYVPVVSNADSIQYKLTPAWLFIATQETTLNKEGTQKKISSNFTILINAVTGEEIRIGGKA